MALAVCAWSLSPLLIYKSRGVAEAPILAMYAVTIGSVVTLLVIVVSGAAPIRTLRALPNRRAWFGEAAGLGLGAFVAYPLLYFSAIQHGPPAAVNLVNYLWPVIAVVVVSALRPRSRSLEIGLAAGFGFAGAGLAIGIRSEFGAGHSELYPFLLAALGALIYGGISGAISIRHPIRREDSLTLFIAALLFGGLVSVLLIGVLAVARPELISLDLDGNVVALVLYGALLPVAHISWMLAVKDERVPAFSAAFLVPVFSTAILGLALTGAAKPEIVSALVLVLCGVMFANSRDRGVPVGYAVALAFLASIQVSQVLASVVSGPVDNQIGTLSELVAAVIAIFAGFVLTNAIQRNDALHRACSRFYARAAGLAGDSPELVRDQLNRLDATVIAGSARGGVAPAAPGLGMEFATEWADVDVAVSNRVSNYEWLVLLVGGGSLIFALHSFAVTSSFAPLVLLRALAVGLVVGILFTIRDYDRHRPQRLCELLRSFRARYGFAPEPGSPLDVGSRYWSQRNPLAIRIGLPFLVAVALVAIVLNG